MQAFNRANEHIRMLLIEEGVFPFDLYDSRIEGWLYQSEYPFQLSHDVDVLKYQFFIRIYQFDLKTNSFLALRWHYKSAPATKLIYVENPNYEAFVNNMGRDFIQTEKFQIVVMPALLEGYREEAFKVLLDTDKEE